MLRVENLGFKRDTGDNLGNMPDGILMSETFTANGKGLYFLLRFENLKK